MLVGGGISRSLSSGEELAMGVPFLLLVPTTLYYGRYSSAALNDQVQRSQYRRSSVDYPGVNYKCCGPSVNVLTIVLQCGAARCNTTVQYWVA